MDNTDQTINSRDVIDELWEYFNEKDELEVAEAEYLELAQLYSFREEKVLVALENLETKRNRVAELADEYDDLIALDKEGRDEFPSWEDGKELIRDSHFREFAESHAFETGAVPSNLVWPLTAINWRQAAEDLQDTYTSVSYGTATYYGEDE